MRMKKPNFNIKKLDVKKLAGSKKLRYGGYATVLTAVVITIAILFNVVITMLESNLGWKIDLTKNQMFTLSEQTEQVLKSLNQDVKIYTLYQVGNENPVVQEVLNKYKNGSKHISLENIDPIKNPTFVEKFDKDNTGIDANSIIVSNKEETKFRVITQYDLYGYNFQTQTYDTFEGEQKITGALMYVTSEKNPKLYFLQGHQEASIDSDLFFLKDYLKSENFEISNLNLVTGDQNLEQGDVLVVPSPKKDLSLEEREKIKEFLNNGGKIVFIFDPMKEDLPNFESLLKLYDVTLNKDLVVEGDQTRYYRSPTVLVPSLESHDITSPLSANNLVAVMPVSRSINLPEVEKSDIEVKPLLVSSEQSWGKVNLDSQSAEKEEGDKDGPLTIGVAITKTNSEDENKSARIVVLGTSQFISSNFAGLSGNVDLFMNSINWVHNQKDSITIRPKTLGGEYLRITDYNMAIILAVVVILVIPVIVLGTGTVVWLRRRHL